MGKSEFRTSIGENIFMQKYAHSGCETWGKLSKKLAERVCSQFLPHATVKEIAEMINNKEFMPAGRFLYYANRSVKFFKNCFLFKSQDDTREDWADTVHKHIRASSAGGGCGNVYSVYRKRGTPLGRTGGVASGAVSAMKMVNDGCRELRQGGGRRVALWGGLHVNHGDALELCYAKDWDNQKVGDTTYGELKRKDFDFHAPLDFMNVSLIYNQDKDFDSSVFLENCKMALRNGEPGFSFDFDNPKECARNACCESTSEEDSDSCTLGSVNLSVIPTIDRLKVVTQLASLFLYCANLSADYPTDKTFVVTKKLMRIGLGIMGLHEWLIVRKYRYEMNSELSNWLEVWRQNSRYCDNLADTLSFSRSIKYRSIAPTGTIGLLAGTTTGIEPIFAVAYKRRYLVENEWKFQLCVDGTAKSLIENYGVIPEQIETALDLAKDVERRIKFQADVQFFVDQAISSTINLPSYGGLQVLHFANLVKKYGPKLRGLTVYPDGARGGQPLSACSYEEALEAKDRVFVEDNDTCKGGVCGI